MDEVPFTTKTIVGYTGAAETFHVCSLCGAMTPQGEAWSSHVAHHNFESQTIELLSKTCHSLSVTMDVVQGLIR